MTIKGTAQAIQVRSEKCHGCLTCQLRCSLRATGKINPSRAHISVIRSPDGYSYGHSFTDECDGCGGDYLCVHWCPYEALQLERSE